MTVAAAKARGFASAAKGSLGWAATCTACTPTWTHIVSGFSYKGDAQRAADAHNAQIHGVKR